MLVVIYVQDEGFIVQSTKYRVASKKQLRYLRIHYQFIASKDISPIWPYLSKNDQRKPFRSLHGLMSRHSLRFCKLIWMKFFHQFCRLQMRFPPTNICDRNGVTDNEFSWNSSYRVFYSSWVPFLYWPSFKPDHYFYFTIRNMYIQCAINQLQLSTGIKYIPHLLHFVAEPFEGRHVV